MNTSLIVIIALVALALFSALFVVGIYNRLVGLRNGFKNAYAQIDVQLKRRYDLIPNLVETAKSYLKHERGTLESVITARNAAAYNDSVMAYNTQREVFPSSIIAGTFNFTAAELFAIKNPEEREPTKVSFA